MVMNKWVNPPRKQKTESEFPPQDPVTVGQGISFNTIKKQVGKKPLSKRSKGDRVSDKSFGAKKKIKPAKVDAATTSKKQSAWDAEFPDSWENENEKGKLFWQLNSSSAPR